MPIHIDVFLLSGCLTKMQMCMFVLMDLKVDIAAQDMCITVLEFRFKSYIQSFETIARWTTIQDSPITLGKTYRVFSS